MNFLLMVFAALVAALTLAEYKERRGAQKWLKPLTAALFIAIAIAGGALYWDYGRWVLYGLVACAAGDVLLLSRNNPVWFKFGMAAFALGHILYVIAFTTFPKVWSFNPLAVLPILMGVAFFVWVRPKLEKDMVIPVAVYSLIIIAMMAMSLGVPMIIVPIAAALFAVSDMWVARDRFVKPEPKNALFITPLYFTAQGLFALSAAI